MYENILLIPTPREKIFFESYVLPASDLESKELNLIIYAKQTYLVIVFIVSLQFVEDLNRNDASDTIIN